MGPFFAVGPFAVFAAVLGPGGGRRRFAERLGAEADDLLDEFLAQALAFERIETPALQGFLDWMRSTATEIRRETDTAQNEVRVMTVHGAKGLEFPIVVLAGLGVKQTHDAPAVLWSDHSGPAIRVTEDREETLGELVIDVTARLSRQLGYRGD